MKRNVVIHDEAIQDVIGAYQWYERQREGLGNDFLFCVEEGFAKLEQSPERYLVFLKKIHRLLIRRFPYGIFYLIA